MTPKAEKVVAAPVKVVEEPAVKKEKKKKNKAKKQPVQQAEPVEEYKPEAIVLTQEDIDDGW